LESRTLLNADPFLLLTAAPPLDAEAVAALESDDPVGAAGGKGGGSAKPTRDDYGNTIAAAYRLALDASGSASLSGKIETANDLDFFSLTAVGTGTLTATVSPNGGKRPVDAEMTLYGSDGTTELAYSNPAGTVSASATIDVIGGQVYYVKASGFNSTTGNYTLQIASTLLPPPPPPSPNPPAFLPGPDAYASATSVSGEVLSTGSGPVLVVRGTDSNDVITLSQAGDTVTVAAAAGATNYSGPFAGIAVYGFAGADTLRATNTLAQAEVTVIYAGLGADQIYEGGLDTAYLYGQDGNDSIVSVGGMADYVFGGAGLDSLWTDSSDTMPDVESAETTAKSVHQITAFVQPTSDPAQAVSLEIAGQDIVDPTAGYAYTNNFVNRPLWADGPQYNDIKQGALGDCYFLAGLSALADTDPGLLQESITALGDGTYAVRFFSGTTEKYYRIDAQLPTSGSNPAYAKLTRNGDELWVPLLEKAFAQFRYGQNSYSSIAGGWMYEAYRAITAASYTSYSTTSRTADQLAQDMANALTAGHAVTAGSPSTSVWPIVGSHAYNVHAVTYENGVWYVTVYTPWGVDGNSYDSNYNDGLLKLTAADFQAAFGTVQVCNA
jgi:hypothetical protein